MPGDDRDQPSRRHLGTGDQPAAALALGVADTRRSVNLDHEKGLGGRGLDATRVDRPRAAVHSIASKRN